MLSGAKAMQIYRSTEIHGTSNLHENIQVMQVYQELPTGMCTSVKQRLMIKTLFLNTKC